MKTYESAYLKINFHEGYVITELTGRRVDRGEGTWHRFSLNAHEALTEYSIRCSKIRERNPDMPLKEVEAIAMCKWAAELDGAQ